MSVPFQVRANLEPMSEPLQFGFRFLRHPVPTHISSTHMVPTLFRECIGVSMFHNQNNYDVLVAASGPGVLSPTVLACTNLLKPDYFLLVMA